MLGTVGRRRAGDVHVLVMASAVNSLTQRILVDLKDAGYNLSLSAVADQLEMHSAFEQAKPDLIVAPYLKKAIPEAIWSACPCLVLHPAVRGGRGPSSLDWAILDGELDWGVTVLQANAKLDGGDIWAHRDFAMRTASKSALYRHEVADAASEAVQQALLRFRAGNYGPTPVDYECQEVRGHLRPVMKQSDRALDWSGSTAEVMRKLRCSDSSPGVADFICGERYYLFGAHEDEFLKGPPGEILAQRHGAICRATGDGSVWIERLRSADPGSVKLPAAVVLGRACRVPELRFPLDAGIKRRTWREIRYEESRQVGYLHFDFYNGALSSSQCRRLQRAYRWARRRPTRAIVLMGGQDLWSNGIDLAAIEAAVDPVEESWTNINAIDDLVRDIITTESHLTCSALAGNAGAGGAILGLAADLVYARDGVVLNPHYKTMHLSGSEYWTYLLPRRVGAQQARDLTEQCRPISARAARSIGMIDSTLPGPLSSFYDALRATLEPMTAGADFDRRLTSKRQLRQRDEARKPLQIYRDEELSQMRCDFTQMAYHEARWRFFHKRSTAVAPL
jgi:putative two-component system protein, hydrogenase maturation factor HypX/HoxX